MPKSTTSDTTSSDPENDGRSFLRRWSERKVDSAAEQPVEASLAEPEIGDTSQVETDQADATTEAPPPVTEADLENLTYESDYTKFLGDNVPDALRRKALRTLWRSDPILANLDGLCDYDDDYTDAALAVKVLQTAHKVGQGYLTDEDLAANRARGEPKVTKVEEAATSDEEFDEDDSEDIEDFDEKNELTESEASVAESQDNATMSNQAANAATDSSADQPVTGAETIETTKS